MRLPEPSSPNSGPFAAPVRGRDSFSFAPVSGMAGSATPGAGFFRPGIDFTSILSGSGGSDRPTPSPIENAPVAPPPSHSTDQNSQIEGEDETVQPWDEEEDEAVEENDSGVVQPLAVTAETPVEADLPVAELDAQAAEFAEITGKAEAILPAAEQQDSASEAAVITGSADSTDQARFTAEQRDAAGKSDQTRETTGQNASVSTAVADGKKQSSEVVGGALDSDSAKLIQDQTTDQLPSQIVMENGSELARGNAPTGAELAAQSQAANAPIVGGQTAVTSDGASEEGANRTPGRHGRGRTGRESTLKARATQSETNVKTREPSGKNDADTAVNQAGAVDSALANGPTDVAAVAEPGAVEMASTPADPLLLQDQGVANLVAGGTSSEPANRPAIGGQTSELGAIGTTSSDDSGRGSDRSTVRADENLSRTDIADRARLIHRITKAFTKMGTDGGQIRMKMHPETLGGVLLEMRVRGRNVEATVTADNEAARGLLQQQLSDLRQRLESQGMTVQRLEVALRDDSATRGSFLNDHRGEMFGGDRGSNGDGDSRRALGYGNAAKRSDSAPGHGGGSHSGPGPIARSLHPAAPGTLDLRL